MNDLKKIRQAVSDHFDSVVTIEKLENIGGTKSVTHAKEVGIYLARMDGHKNSDIADIFGYKDSKAVSRVFSKACEDIQFDGSLIHNVSEVAEKLGIDLD